MHFGLGSKIMRVINCAQKWQGLLIFVVLKNTFIYVTVKLYP